MGSARCGCWLGGSPPNLSVRQLDVLAVRVQSGDDAKTDRLTHWWHGS
jgi:hypothetical protein